MYIVGEVESHEAVRKLINDIRIELKALEVKLKEKLRSKFVSKPIRNIRMMINGSFQTSALTEPSVEWLEHRLKTLTLCLRRLEETEQFIESYWKANLPVKNSYDEHPFNDPRLVHEVNISQWLVVIFHRFLESRIETRSIEIHSRITQHSTEIQRTIDSYGTSSCSIDCKYFRERRVFSILISQSEERNSFIDR